jgi:hypothetical protein
MRSKTLTRWILVVLTAGWAALVVAEKVTLEKSVPVAGKKANQEKLSGRIVSYDDAGFELKVKGDETETVAWDDLDTKTQYAVRRSLIRVKDAPAHIALGQTMLGLKGGKEFAEKAFALALKIDPSTKAAIEEAKKLAATRPTTKPAVEKKIDPGEKPAMTENDANAAGPQMVGGVEKNFWGEQTPEQQEAAIAELKAFAAKTEKTLGKSLKLNETNYFLFYSDLDDREAKNWAGLLDRMYGMLAKLFGVEPKTNIWRGKALVFVFRSSSDYRRFQSSMHQTDAGSTLGMCHTYGNGLVHIAFYRPDKELEFAHVLVHESVHGFIHRYKSPGRVPSWANEGLAEWIATQLLIDKRPNHAKDVRYAAQYWLREYGGLHGFFDTDHIEGWQYPVAEMMTTFMMSESKKNYVAFIDGIKDGLTPEESLRTKYKAPRDRLIPAFAKYLGVRIDG